jgi:hypothetical protein
MKYIHSHWSGSEFLISILHGPESMLPHRTQNFTWLLILWQLVLPLSAPCLHTLSGDGCANTCSSRETLVQASCDISQIAHGTRHIQCGCHCGTGNFRSPSEKSSPSRAPHDCSNCSICQAIAAPRTLATIVEIATSEHIIATIASISCADPMLGFGLPPQCRAPPCL